MGGAGGGKHTKRLGDCLAKRLLKVACGRLPVKQQCMNMGIALKECGKIVGDGAFYITV